jgi:hypothetical protein
MGFPFHIIPSGFFMDIHSILQLFHPFGIEEKEVK